MLKMLKCQMQCKIMYIDLNFGLYLSYSETRPSVKDMRVIIKNKGCSIRTVISNPYLV